MFLRSLAALTFTSTLVLGLGACGDDKDDDTSTTLNPTNNNPTPGGSQSDTSAGDTDPATDTGDTTNIVTGSSMSEATDTTANPTTTANPSEPVTTTMPSDTSAETGPDPSATDPSATDPSATDTATTDPATTDPSDTSTGGNTDGFYGPCAMTDPPCPAGSDCLSIEGLEGNFCSPKCDGDMCPDSPMGTAQAQCALTMMGSMDPVNCALVCQFPAVPGQCPDGTTCKQLPAPNDMLGLCTAP